MNKLIIAAAAVAAATGGYYLSTLGGESNDNSVVSATNHNPILDYVPADTILYSGSLKPFPTKNYLKSFVAYHEKLDTESLQTAESTPLDRFVFNIVQQYADNAKNPDLLLKTFGMPDETSSYIYTLGIFPVLKTTVTNADAFWAVLDKAEKESGFTHEKRQISGMEYRFYSLDSDGSEYGLIVAQDKGILTIAWDANSTNDVLEIMLGLKKAPKSLADSGIIDNLVNTYKYKDGSVFFLNNQEIIKGLTTTDGNMLAQQLTQVIASPDISESTSNHIKEWRTPVCHAELTSISNNWPRIVSGTTNMRVSASESEIDYLTVIETKNQTILTALKEMSGFIPSYIKSNHDNLAFSFGLGVNADKLASSVTTIWSDLQQPKFKCAPLESLQYDIEQQNPAMLAMMTGMVAGLKGASFSVFDYQLGDDLSQITHLDSLTTISGENPIMLYKLIADSIPQLAGTTTTLESGKEIDLSEIFKSPPVYDIKTSLALKGKHIAVYTGDKSTVLANSLQKESLDSNYFYSLSFDYKKVFAPLLSVATTMGDKEVIKSLNQVKNIDMRLKTDLSVDEKGLVFDTTVHVKADKSTK